MVPDGMRREADRIGDDSIMIAESVIRPGIHGKPDRLHVPVLELLQRLVGREEAVKRYISLGHGTFGELSKPGPVTALGGGGTGVLFFDCSWGASSWSTEDAFAGLSGR